MKWRACRKLIRQRIRAAWGEHTSSCTAPKVGQAPSIDEHHPGRLNRLRLTGADTTGDRSYFTTKRARQGWHHD